MKRHWNNALQSLVLIRFGQELGTQSEAAQAISCTIEFLLSTLSRIFS